MLPGWGGVVAFWVGAYWPTEEREDLRPFFVGLLLLAVGIIFGTLGALVVTWKHREARHLGPILVNFGPIFLFALVALLVAILQ
jgi:hypothetical protein